MKVLLRHQKTSLYVDCAAQWTADRERARDFVGSVSAVQHVSALQLQDMEAVLTFGEPCYDLILPLGALPGACPRIDRPRIGA